MPNKTVVKRSVYYDSVKLMLVTREVKAMAGVSEVAVVMGTDLNKDALSRTGLMTPEAEQATPTDMIVGLICDTDETINEVLGKLDGMLNANTVGKSKDVYKPKSIETAVKMQPGSNLCTISVPGRYAKGLAMEALRNNLHVMLFSDNVTIEEEREMKLYAQKKNLLVMGPDCGTAMINGVPLCFANKIRRGNIGIVAASGTGAQEVMTLIHKNGGGVSHVIGTGGRDLKAEIGGITYMQAIDALNHDPSTEIITLISKPPAQQVAEKIMDYLKNSVQKPVVVNFLGQDQPTQEIPGIHFVPTLEAAALRSLQCAGVIPENHSLAGSLQEIAQTEAAKLPNGAKYIRGLFSGGTLAAEAVMALQGQMGSIQSNLGSEIPITDCFAMEGHACVDLGDDEYTVGRAHPMIDASLRAELLSHELRNGETAVILLDIVLGYGASRTPEKELLAEIAAYKHEPGSKYVSIVASVCGCEQDPQDYAGLCQALAEHGVIVMPSNLKATELAGHIASLIQ